MNRVNLGWFCDLGAELKPLTSAQILGEPNVALPKLFRLKQLLEVLIDASNPIRMALRVSKPIIWNLISELNEVFGDLSDVNAISDRYTRKQANIYSLVAKLDAVLISELGVQPTYQVVSKRAYDVEILVENAAAIFDPSVMAELSEEEKYDIQQAGRCLVFELPTAAAFHIFRAMESAIRNYYDVVVGTLPTVKMRNWGSYIKNLRQCNGDPKILAMLEQIKDLHRNPIIHPEHKIDVEEALSLIGVAESLIAAIRREIRARTSANQSQIRLAQ